jgi:hypothetical protein
MRRFAWLLSALLALLGCEQSTAPLGASFATVTGLLAERDFDLELCRQRIAALMEEPDLGGAPRYDQRRVEFLGRALGEPMLFVSAPDARTEHVAATRFGALVATSRLLAKHRGRPAALREKVLRQGYVFANEPNQAFALVKTLRLPALFDDDVVWLSRGDRVHRLVREKHRSGHRYRFGEGPERGRVARLLFGDRVAALRDSLRQPLHRDARSLRDRVGFERMRVSHRRPEALLAQLRFAGQWVDTVIESRGARLDLGCIDADAATRRRIAATASADAGRRRALSQLHRTVDELVAERLPFDRPRGAEDHFSDGQLRPLWNDAYRRGWRSFEHDDKTYRVFDGDGRPHPPQMCVETIVDTFERAAGSWYRPLGEQRQRVAGTIDFTALGLHNRAGVIAFETFARERPEHFEHRRIPTSERIPFVERKRFFAYLLDNADRFQPGDVIAIRGPKADGYVHQHAILIEDVDPLTGFPHVLFDQMNRPRRRTFEMIMAEAPRRSLFYQVRLRRALLSRLSKLR